MGPERRHERYDGQTVRRTNGTADERYTGRTTQTTAAAGGGDRDRRTVDTKTRQNTPAVYLHHLFRSIHHWHNIID